MKNVIWYIPDESGQPRGPYSADQISMWLTANQIPQTILCWREGMGQWLPLTAAEPFATEIELTKSAAKKRVRRIVIAISCIVCAVATAVAVYIITMAPPEIRRARKLMAAELYAETSEVLGKYVGENPLSNEAAYLFAIARINEYATSKPDSFGFVSGLLGSEPVLGRAKDRLARVFKVDPKWIEEAKTDIANAAIRIPSDASDAINRRLAISHLQVELDLADKQELAAELMSHLQALGNQGGRVILQNEGVLQSILAWDPSLDKQIIEFAVDTASNSEQELWRTLGMLKRWAKQRPPMAPLVALQLSNKAGALHTAGRNTEAKAMLTLALEINPEKAKERETALLFIKLMDPDAAKLTRCQYFCRQWPQSPDIADVLMVMVRDAVTVFDAYGRWRRSQTQPHLRAGYGAAKQLIQKFKTTHRLDVETYKLAERLARDKQYNKATELMSDLLKALPNSAIHHEISDSVARWRQQVPGTGDAPVPAPRPPGGPTVPGIPGTTVPRPPNGGHVPTESESSRQPNRIVDATELHRVLAGDMTQGVLWIALSKVAIGAVDIKKLQDWTRAGGVLWLETDAAEFFGFGNVRRVTSQEMRGNAVVFGVAHPVAQGLQGRLIGYEVSLGGGKIYGTEQAISNSVSSVIPLLVRSEPVRRGRRINMIVHVLCGIRRYGNGFVVLRPAKIYTGTPDGRRFEENLRSFSTQTATLSIPRR